MQSQAADSEIEEKKNNSEQGPKWSQSDFEYEEDNSSLFEVENNKSGRRPNQKVDLS